MVLLFLWREKRAVTASPARCAEPTRHGPQNSWVAPSRSWAAVKDPAKVVILHTSLR